MTVLYEQTGAVATITLNRPEALNAFNGDLRVDLLKAMTKASGDKSVRCIIITGAGRGFCAGADVSAATDPRLVEDVLNTEYSNFLTVIRTCEKPVIAAVNGPAAGIGMSLALTCDLVVIDPEAYLMAAFANIGLVADGGLSWLLTQQLGYARAFQAAIEAEKLSADFCLQNGLVNRVSAPGAALAEAQSWAATLVERAPLATTAIKRAFRAAAQKGLAEAMSYEAILQNTNIQTEDCREGVTALFEKRKPQFKGR